MKAMIFTDRIQAGKLLAERLNQELTDVPSESMVVLSIPRGGVVVAREVADRLACEHDVIVTKKLRAPTQAELAIGAIGETEGSLYLDERLAHEVGAGKEYISQEIVDRQEEIKRREKIYRQAREKSLLKDKTVIIVDDGAATGATIIAAAREVWESNPHKVVIALPVCASETLGKLEKEADAVVALDIPGIFYAVGQFYQDFPQVNDEEVMSLLGKRR